MNLLLRNLVSGSPRTIVVKKNILGSFVIKGLSILASLVLVPYTIHLLDQEKYGIWITIFSIVTWFNMLDIGMGNGFRNKFAEALALDNKKLAKEYVQTLYSLIGIIAVIFFAVSTATANLLNWHLILNITTDFDENINFIVWSVFSLFCMQLYLKNISTVLLSLQKTTYSNSLILLGNILALLFIFILQKLNMTSLFSIAMAFMSAPIIVFFLSTIIIFNRELKEFKPKVFARPKKEHLHDLIGLGLKFFFIQITTIVIFSSSNIIITQLYSPSDVTPYNVAFRLYSSVQVVFAIILTPFWSAFTEANSKEDFKWIRKSIKNLIAVWGLFSVGTIVLWIVSPFVFRIWIGKEVVIPFSLSLQFAIFAVLMTWTSIFSSYVAGVGKITVSLLGAVFQFIVYIPLAIFLAKGMNLYTTGIIMATNINLLLPAFFLALQTKKILTKKAYGIWNK